MKILSLKGAEFEVLKQVPWEKVKVEVILLELEHAGKVQDDLYDDLDEW